MALGEHRDIRKQERVCAKRGRYVRLAAVLQILCHLPQVIYSVSEVSLDGVLIHAANVLPDLLHQLLQNCRTNLHTKPTDFIIVR